MQKITAFFEQITPEKNKYRGMSMRTTVFLWGGAGIIAIAWVYLAVHLTSPLVHFFLIVAAPVIPGALILWFRAYSATFAEKFEKTTTTLKRLQSKSSYFESILQDSTDIIFTIDIDGFILKFNKGSELHFGYTQAEIVGVPFKNFFVNEADERKILDAVLLCGKSVNEEISMKTREGEIILLNLSVSEMKNDYAQIIGLVVTAKDITEKKKLEMELVRKNEMLGRLAITDSLTGLFNARHFYDQIKKELLRMRRNVDRRLSLVLIDVDHFKEFNDTEGHQMGDKVLKSLGEVINVCIRKDIDTGYRYGGDEFLVLLPDTDKVQAHVVAKRIQKQFSAFKFGRTSLSIGIAEAKPGDDEKKLVKQADEAMYISKREGRARISVYEG